MKIPRGFKFGGSACGIKASGKKDLALICTQQPAVAAGVYTQNVVCAASIDWNRSITPSAEFRAVVVNSGNCLLYTSPSPRDQRGSRMPSSA